MIEATIRFAESAADYRSFSALIGVYTDWCRERYADDKWFVEAAFGHQSLESELDVLPIKYGPPNGRTLLADAGGKIRGCCAFRRLSDEVCEMKRLFVPMRFQGQGLGKRLAETAMSAAYDEGYRLMRLDTANLLTEAIAMYRALGFEACAPYHRYPDELMPYILFMERPLKGSPA